MGELPDSLAVFCGHSYYSPTPALDRPISIRGISRAADLIGGFVQGIRNQSEDLGRPSFDWLVRPTLARISTCLAGSARVTSVPIGENADFRLAIAQRVQYLELGWGDQGKKSQAKRRIYYLCQLAKLLGLAIKIKHFV